MKKTFYLIPFLIMLFCGNAFANCNIVYGVYFDYKPYEWTENGKFYGINIDLMEAIADKAGCSVTYVSYPWFEMVKKLKSGEIDILSSSINSDTLSYAAPLVTNFVQYRTVWGKRDSAPVTDIRQLENKKVLIAEDNIGYAMLNRDRIKALLILKTTEDEILQALTDGEGDYAIIDNSAYYLLEKYPDLKLVSDPIFPTLYGFILKSGNPKYPMINSILEDLKESGKYYKIVNDSESKRYFKFLKIAIGIVLAGFWVFIIVMIWNKSLHGQVTKKTKSLNDEIINHIETETMLRIKTEENNNNIKLLQTILNTIPETIYVIDKNLGILWRSNIKPHHCDMEIIADDIRYALEADHESAEFTVKDTENNIWKILMIRFRYVSEDNYLIVAKDITDNLRLQDELFMTTRYSALGEMSAVIAHEINTPLGSVLHNMDFLSEYLCSEDDATHEDIESALSIVDKSLIKIKNIVDELKKYTNRQSKEYGAVDLAECCRAAVGITRFMINKSTSDFEMMVPDEPLFINGNAGEMEQIIINILQNACYALTSKNQKILLSLRRENENIVVSVADEGRGMDDATLKKATLPYFTTRKEKGGTGLGLSLTSRLIKEHGARLEILSKVGAGTTVRIVFDKGG